MLTLNATTRIRIHRIQYRHRLLAAAPPPQSPRTPDNRSPHRLLPPLRHSQRPNPRFMHLPPSLH